MDLNPLEECRSVRYRHSSGPTCPLLSQWEPLESGAAASDANPTVLVSLPSGVRRRPKLLRLFLAADVALSGPLVSSR